jgi:hypothetical protein
MAWSEGSVRPGARASPGQVGDAPRRSSEDTSARRAPLRWRWMRACPGSLPQNYHCLGGRGGGAAEVKFCGGVFGEASPDFPSLAATRSTGAGLEAGTGGALTTKYCQKRIPALRKVSGDDGTSFYLAGEAEAGHRGRRHELLPCRGSRGRTLFLRGCPVCSAAARAPPPLGGRA